jgi:hypothetical protein
MGSPPPAGSKKEVLRFRSVRSIVIAPAKTGRDRSKRRVVITTAHTKSGTFSGFISFGRIFLIVDIKLMEPKIEEAPAKCREKIAISTAGPLCDRFLDKGG